MKNYPPETQTGANTLGFYMNEELLSYYIRPKGYISAAMWYPGDSYGTPAHLRIEALLSFRKGYASLILQDSVMEVNKIQIATFADDNVGGTQFVALNDGEITLTRLDPVNKIVSGTFAFKAKQLLSTLPDFRDSTVFITQGRFDLSHLYVP